MSDKNRIIPIDKESISSPIPYIDMGGNYYTTDNHTITIFDKHKKKQELIEEMFFDGIDNEIQEIYPSIQAESQKVNWYELDEVVRNRLNELDESIANAYIGSLPNFITSIDYNSDPQAIDEFDNYIVASSDQGYLYIYDKTNPDQTPQKIYLGDYHLGGVQYYNGYLYVATGSKISKYNFSELLKGNTECEKYQNTKTNTNVKDWVSFLTISNNKELITGIFKNKDVSDFQDRGGADSDLILYSIDTETGDLTQNRTVKLPKNISKVQGICVYEKEGQEYYFITSSYGKSDNNISTFYIATLDETTNELIEQASYTLPSGAEQVSVTSDNNIVVIFEGDTSKENIIILDPSKLIP